MSGGRETEAFSAWRASVTEKLRGRPFESLVSTLAGGLSVAPLAVAGPRTPALRGGRARFGGVLRDAEAAPIGPVVAWWCGEPGAASSTTELRIVERGPATLPAFDGATFRVEEGFDGLSVHERGAAPATEIAAVLERVLAAGATGAPIATVAVTGDVTVEIAKLRALRAGLAGLTAKLGAPMPLVCVRTSYRMTSRLDPDTNLVRTALATFAALVGGADVVCALPFDAAEPTASELGTRMAWTSAAVLALESGLDRPGDLAAGSHHVEALTLELGRAAWAIVRELEAGGSLEERIVREAAEHARALRTRQRVLVGASRFPPHGASLPTGAESELGGPLVKRDAEHFEALGHRGHEKDATLLAIGDRSLEPRTAFVTELAQIAHLRLGRRGPFADAAAALPACEGVSPLVFLSASDALLEEGGVAIVRALREGGAKEIVVAGKSKAEAVLREAGATAFVYTGSDVVGALLAALDGAYGGSP